MPDSCNRCNRCNRCRVCNRCNRCVAAVVAFATIATIATVASVATVGTIATVVAVATIATVAAVEAIATIATIAMVASIATVAMVPTVASVATVVTGAILERDPLPVGLLLTQSNSSELLLSEFLCCSCRLIEFQRVCSKKHPTEGGAPPRKWLLRTQPSSLDVLDLRLVRNFGLVTSLDSVCSALGYARIS